MQLLMSDPPQELRVMSQPITRQTPKPKPSPDIDPSPPRKPSPRSLEDIQAALESRPEIDHDELLMELDMDILLGKKR